ncbi:sulfatase-like hydrolase/transferase [Bacteroides nordii]|uniref:sulfatase-like hydrolase/transferase n=1 Tax=Bacteroides nordii TaxID=291645 RepID=UPI002A809EF3|nr:sulfatase-like hydrolase/transferase [Bacteroides nordii]
MKYKLLSALPGLILPLAHSNATGQKQPEQPNILCIVCEDISPYLGCYGDAVAVTPNLDNFSRESIRYTGMYTTIGVSSPSRAALITGMYPTSIGANNMRTAQNKSKPAGIHPYDVVLPAGIKCYTEQMRAAGYFCTNNSKTDYQFAAPLTAWDEQGDRAHWKHAPEGMPFFSIFNLNVTHEFQVMKRADQPLSVQPEDIILPPYYPDDPVVRKDMAILYSNITEMDRQFQILVDELKASGKLDNTIIIWYSDNGGPMPRQKRELYESGALVPFMIRFPDGYKAGTVDRGLHMFVDIPATILSLAGLPVPEYMHGRPFLGQYKQKSRKYVYGARDRLDTFYEKQGCVRDERYRYIRNYRTEQPDYLPIISRAAMPMMARMAELHEAGKLNADQEKWFKYPRPEIEFYDVQADPHELNNLADDPKYKKKIKELSDEFDRWISTYNKMWKYTEPELIEMFRPGGIQPVVARPEVKIENGTATLTCSTEGASIAYQINGRGLNEHHWFLYTGPFSVNPGDKISAIGVRAGYKDSSIQAEADELLAEWVETLLTYQINHKNASLDGGLLCPACARVHGRCGDAVLPLMYIAEKTCNEKYVTAAKNLMHWMGNVHQPDGSWMNDVNVSDWNGTTVFAAIALYEALHHHGHLLDDSTRNAWREQLLQAGEFIYGDKFIYSRRREGMRNMNVNYSASAIYALFAIGTEFNRQDFIARARETAGDLKAFFTTNEYFLFGEGPEIKKKTRNGCLPVDLLYNVEESLPNMVYYAHMADDKELMALLEKSMDTHLEFMLPDGAWDNSWGTRSFKWTYWGGRTSDGFMGGYYTLADRHPEYAEAIHRNIALLKKATHNGLLHGGMNYHDCGVEACIHHTFGHAKALASFLNQPVVTPAPVLLPRDKAYGVKRFEDINTWLVSEGEWRATVTGFDSEYKVKGTHPMGGVLSMLWNKQIGPVFAATMNLYTLIEAPNMQAYTQPHRMAGSPRIELIENGTMYSNLDDLDTKITYQKKGNAHQFHIVTHLVDSKQQFSSAGKEAVEIDYIFQEKEIGIHCSIPESLRKAGAQLTLPIIAAPQEKENITEHSVQVNKEGGVLLLNSPQTLTIAPTDENGRIFNPVPGFCFIPVIVQPNEKGEVEISIRITAP